jgi:magnesium-transporting ATPase (P-type)
MARPEDTGSLMIIYGVGAASIFLILMLMYRYALKISDQLQLNKLEEFDTRASMTTNFLMATVPMLSVILAWIFQDSPWAGMISGFAYFLYMPLMFIYNGRRAKRRKKVLKEFSPLLT